MFHDDRHIRQEIRRLKRQITQNPLLFARLGDCYLRLGDSEQAEAVLKEGIGTVQDYPNAYRVLAEIQFWKGFYRDAEENCRKGLERDPKHLGLLHLLMRIKKKEDNDWEASQIQRTLARLDPLHAPEYVIETDASAEVAEEPGVPSPANVWKIKASRRGRKKEPEFEAMPEPTMAADAGGTAPTNVELAREPATKTEANGGLVLQKYLNEILESTEQVAAEEEAGEPSEQAETAPGGIATRTLAELYAKQGKYDESIEVYRRLLDVDPLNEAYRNRLHELVQLQEADLEKRKANQDG
jgi:tetratricopeptide (TPR) repeat protein